MLIGLVPATQEAENRKQAQHLRREVLHSKNTDGKDATSNDDDDDDDDDDKDDDDDDKKDPENVKDAHQEVMTAEKALYANLHEAADAKLKLVKLADRKGQKDEVDENIAQVSKETQSASLASFAAILAVLASSDAFAISVSSTAIAATSVTRHFVHLVSAALPAARREHGLPPFASAIRSCWS